MAKTGVRLQALLAGLSVFLALQAGAAILSDSPDWSAEGDANSVNLGWSVSTAGDVNRDNYSDIIVGAPNYSNPEVLEGAAFVYYGSPNGPSLAADWSAEGNTAGALFGWSVSTAGDINLDAYSDILIGAPGYDNGQSAEGALFVYYGSSSGPSLTPDWTDEGDIAGYALGMAVATAGDFDMDQRTEILAIAGYGDALYYQNAGGVLPAGPTWLLIPANGAFESIAPAGDVNGDGLCDFLVGNPSHTGTLSGQGYVALHLGATGFNPDLEILGPHADANLGNAVGMAGDVDGDGYSDIIVASKGFTNGASREGGVFVYHGAPAGVDATADWSVEGGQFNHELGSAVSYAGDVNGDGFADVIIGSSQERVDQTLEGLAYVYLGGPGGLDADYIWRGEGNVVNAEFGHSVSVAGDVNGDGFSDVIVGAPALQNGHGEEGAAFVFYGSGQIPGISEGWSAVGESASVYLGTALAGAVDLNGDGYSDFAIGSAGYNGGEFQEGRIQVYYGGTSGPAGVADWEYEPDIVDALAGEWLAGVGDVNGDGYSDLVAGVNQWTGGVDRRAILFLGGWSGLEAAPAWDSETDGEVVAAAGDVNGDGYLDLLVGDNLHSHPDQYEGRAMLYLGSDNAFTEHPNWVVESDIEMAMMGAALSGAGDLNGDGYSDVLIGLPGEEQVWVYYGHPLGLPGTPGTLVGLPGIGSNLATAGDVNGDGYSDALVGAEWDGVGGAYVFHGSASGIDGADWFAVPPPGASNFGHSVAAAGDVNCDGYSDILIGDHQYANGEPSEGVACLYLGSATGLEATCVWEVEPNAQGQFGSVVATAGDVNGDGYPDILVSGPYLNDLVFYEGRVNLYYGNHRPGRPLIPFQGRPDATPVQLLGHTHDVQRVRVGMLKNSSVGWTYSQMLIDTEYLGTPLDNDTWSGGISMAMSPPSLERYTLNFGSAPEGQPFHWRARFRYYPYMDYTRWVSPGVNAPGETDFRLEVSCTVAGPDNNCNGIDDDCDGPADEDWVPVTDCGTGYCQDTNIPASCYQGVETSCQPGTPLDTVDETCDGVDDDCDGQTDEEADSAGTCDDGLYCTGVEYCDEGSGCLAGVPPDCDDSIGCTQDVCNEGTDQCDHVPEHTQCSDGNPCTYDTCDPVLGCQNPDHDGIPCTILDCTGVCQGGLCEGCTCAVDADCHDGVSCTLDTCQAGMCNNLPQDAVCDDGEYCTGTETCDPLGDCQAGTPVDCSDGVDCTVDACAEDTDSCASAPNDAFCDNGLYCDGDERCDAVLGCTPGVGPDCNDGIACTEDLCDEDQNACDNPLQADYCYIEASCVPAGTHVPGEPCVACLPDTLTSDWSQLPPGTPCGESTCESGLYTPAPLCDAAGICQDQASYPCESGTCVSPQECQQTGDGVLLVSPGPDIEPGTRVWGREPVAVLHLEMEASGAAGRLTRMRLDFPGLAEIPVYWHEVRVRLLADGEPIGEALLDSGEADFADLDFGYQNNSRHQLTIELFSVRRALGASATCAWLLLAGMSLTVVLRRRRFFLLVVLGCLLLLPVACQVGYQRMIFDGRVTLDPESDVAASARGSGSIAVDGDPIEGERFLLDLSF